MATTTTVGKHALLAGIKTQAEAAGAAGAPVLVYLAGATAVATVNATLATPASGTMSVTGAAGSNTATGTLTAVELRDRSGNALRSYTIGATGSGRDIIVTPSGSGVSASGNDIVLSATGVTIGAATITETPA